MINKYATVKNISQKQNHIHSLAFRNCVNYVTNLIY